MRALFVEPFFGGSHARFARAITEHCPGDWTLITMPDRHWKWRMRGSALWMAEQAELGQPYDLLFVTSYLPLAELLGLRPELRSVPSILYFHENQLTYPVQKDEPRDHHFGFTQIVSASVATRCVFNSAFNRDSFLDAAETLLARLPDRVPTDLVERIAKKSCVMGVPLLMEAAPIEPSPGPPTILWNHRWEHDKGPEAFFEALFAQTRAFQLIVCGQRYRSAPAIFDEARRRLGDAVLHFGPADETIYRELLLKTDLAVSAATHEFFGISILEAVHFGARPVVPDRLAYVELFPEEFRYQDLKSTLDTLLATADHRADRRHLTAPFGRPLLDRYQALFEEMTQG